MPFASAVKQGEKIAHIELRWGSVKPLKKLHRGSVESVDSLYELCHTSENMFFFCNSDAENHEENEKNEELKAEEHVQEEGVLDPTE